MSTIENPNQEVIEVDCSSWVPTVRVRVIVNGDSEVQERVFSLSNTFPAEEDKYKLTLRGFSVPPRDVGFCLLQIKDLVVASLCQKSSEMSLGSIGELRCPTFNDAKIASSKCVTASNCLQTSTVNWGWFVRNNQINISTIIRSNTLPIHHSVTHHTFDASRF